ncbi:MAG: alternative ribosome rescue aminoacyl-tRNA hydrolase ArfB [Planctomycetota bacterium]|nr:alternative ribosome rescue aminoacyl-tRNA hydrolase ArfB [Planctomycetota bacterium]
MSDTPGNTVRMAPGVEIPADAITFSFVSSSGPGGQNVNKRATKAVLRVRVADIPIPPDAGERLRRLGSMYLTGDDELVIAADDLRSQGRNRDDAIDRLRELVRAALVRPKVRRATKPTRGSRERRITEKKQRGETKRRRQDRAD